MDKVVATFVGVIGLVLSLGSFFSARTRAYTLANQSFTLAKLLQDQNDPALDAATRRTAAALRQETLIRGHRATHDFLDSTRPGRRRTLIEALGVVVNLTILAVGILGMRVSEDWQVGKIWAGVATIIVGLFVATLMVCSGQKHEKRERDLETKGRPELTVTGGVLK